MRGSKFNPVSSEGVLVGFDEDNYNYHIFDLKSQKILITHHASFNENSFPFREPPSHSVVAPVTHLVPKENVNIQFFDEDSEDEYVETVNEAHDENFEVPDSDSQLTGLNPPSESPAPPVAPRRSTRPREHIKYTASATCDDASISALTIAWENSHMFDLALSSCNLVTNVDETPRSFSKAVSGYEGKRWMAACEKEVQAMVDKQVWVLVDRPKSANVIRGLWLFRKKPVTMSSPSADASVHFKYKARYVAMGNHQVHVQDYFDTFAPTGKPTSLRLLVAIAALHGWEVHQMDAVTAFLNSDLNETIYVEQPEGFKAQGEEDKVCMLLKSLYGLKQAPKCWQDDVEEFLVSIGFKQCEVDHCIYIRDENGLFTAVYVHVDDLAITGNDISNFKIQISQKGEMEDLGIASTVVGIEIKREAEFVYSICQTAYAAKILNRFDACELKPTSTPLPPGLKLFKPDREEIDDFASKKLPYRSVVGSLMYLAQCTRPDLAYAVGVLSQHLDWPGFQHWKAANHVLRYLAGTVNLGIRYSGLSSPEPVRGLKSEDCPQALCDADWAGDKDTRRSTTGYVFVLAGGAISWRSKLQSTVALSSTEAEY